MTSLSNILLPDIQSSSEDELGERPAKHRKSTPPHVVATSLSPTPEQFNGVLKDERKAKWLAGLAYEELLGVAQGATWKVGGLHSKNCFTCKKPGTVIECHNCPRSYHRRCLNPPIHGNFKIDGPWFCPNCKLLMEGEGDGSMVTGMILNHKTKQGEMMMKVEVDVDNVTPLHRVIENVVKNKRAELPTRQFGNHPSIAGSTEENQYEKHHKKSRYSTLSSDVDDALGLLNRELEQSGQRRIIISEMMGKLGEVEQEREMWKGRASLVGSNQKTDDEILSAAEVKRLNIENDELKKMLEMQTTDLKRKEREWETWRREMQALIHEK